MTVEREQTLFGSTQMLHTNFGVHVVKNRRISPELIQTDPEEIWADFTLYMDRARQYEDQKIFESSSPAKIILNTNKNVDRPIRFFFDNERAQDTIDDWDPMELSRIFSDNVTNKYVLETLDNLRDRLS